MLSSVLQGLVLGPCLFLLYTNDLHELLSSNVRLFADDTIAYLTTDSELESRPLQNDLEKQKHNGSKCGINARSSVARNVGLSCMTVSSMVKPSN